MRLFAIWIILGLTTVLACPCKADTSAPEAIWKRDLRDAIVSSVAVGRHGEIYCLAGKGILFTLNSTGEILDRTTLSQPREIRIDSTPAIGLDDRIYIGTFDMFVAMRSGKPDWLLSPGNVKMSSPAVACNGFVCFGASDGNMRLFTPDGKLVWSKEVHTMDFSAPIIDRNERIYFGSAGRLVSMSNKGEVLWTVYVGHFISAPPGLDRAGNLYFSNLAGEFYSVTSDGYIRWSFRADTQSYSSPAIASDGTSYFTSYGGMLYALDSSGAKKWSFATGDNIVSSPAIDSAGVIYFGCRDGYLYAVNPDGSRKWRVKTGNITASPVISKAGILYIGSTNGFLYGIRVGSNGSTPQWPMQRGNSQGTASACGGN